MAKIKLGALREQEASYHLYKQPSERGEIIVVRRKLAMPSDVEHRSSRETKRQRERFGEASKRWASIPGPLKAELREKYGIVDTQTPHGLSEIKVLQGAQLFLSQEIHQQKYHQAHQEIPLYACIILVDQFLNPLDGDLTLFYQEAGMLYPIPPMKLCPANFLFVGIPRGKEAYYPRGTMAGYYDPGEVQLSDQELPGYHYHQLKPGTGPAGQETSDQCQNPITNANVPWIWEGRGQTFSPEYNYGLEGLALRINQGSLGRKANIMLKLLTDEGPDQEGTTLWQTQFQSQDLPPPNSQAWTYFNIPDIPLFQGSKYRYVLYFFPPCYYWDGEKWVEGGGINIFNQWTGTNYPRGAACGGWNFETHHGPWVVHEGDRNFICYR